MLKYYCDICKKEIEDVQFMGELHIKERFISFIKHQKEDNIRVLGFIFCQDCSEKIKKHVMEQQKDGKL
jgi:uncharacterized protein with PIN domain